MLTIFIPFDAIFYVEVNSANGNCTTIAWSSPSPFINMFMFHSDGYNVHGTRRFKTMSGRIRGQLIQQIALLT